LPEAVHINDLDRSWEIFTLLEAFADGYGAWRIQDVLGKPLIELDDALVEDLLTLRHLAEIARGQTDKK
jgi:hypothetical protein